MIGTPWEVPVPRKVIEKDMRAQKYFAQR